MASNLDSLVKAGKIAATNQAAAVVNAQATAAAIAAQLGRPADLVAGKTPDGSSTTTRAMT